MLKIKEIQDITDSLELECCHEYYHLLHHHPAQYPLVCNGVGSETSWTYHLTPDTIWFLDISPSSGIHDWDFTYPLYFESYQAGMQHFHDANRRFRDNIEKQIAAANWLLRPVRRARKQEYYFLLETFRASHNSFWSNKTLPLDWAENCNYTPDFSNKKYLLNKQILEAIMHHVD